MVTDPVAADHVRLMVEMYAEPETSFGNITRYFEEQGIKIYEKSIDDFKNMYGITEEIEKEY